MTFYQELQLNQAGSKSLLKNSKTMKEKLYHAFVYMVKIAVTMVFALPLSLPQVLYWERITALWE